MLINEREKLASILQTTADVLDIPDHVYEDAVLKYEDVGEHLAAEESDLRQYAPRIYPQGSFKLGTVVHPYGREDEYDIDLVCQLAIPKDGITQADLKNKVGNRLKAREDLAKIVSPLRRCWTLSYPSQTGTPGFHMDVLPSILNEERPPTGILLTDTELTRWQKSNPIAYSEWFHKRMEVIFKLRKTALAESLRISIEDVPVWRVKTPLQRSVQILKRHRDIYFLGKPEVRPVSITLTTLAARAYQNQEDVFESLTCIAARMSAFVENRNGKWWVENPVDPDENFADKWNEYPERREAFVHWLKKVEDDFIKMSKAGSLSGGLTLLDESLGRETMTKVASALGVPRVPFAPATVTMALAPALGDARHAKALQWPHVAKYAVKVSAAVYHRKGGNKLWALGKDSVPKKVWLRFEAVTDVPEPYSIQWQVVNTGLEADRAGQTRGDFYDSNSDKRVRWESTAYRGTHWVEAFVLKAGVCVARSGRILVPIR
jgi:hypothetical protein